MSLFSIFVDVNRTIMDVTDLEALTEYSSVDIVRKRTFFR